MGAAVQDMKDAEKLYVDGAKSRFNVFLDYIQPGYSQQKFHTLIARSCQRLFEGTLGTSKLMLFVPPQHGKSEIVSRKFPAWAFGRNPRMTWVS